MARCLDAPIYLTPVLAVSYSSSSQTIRSLETNLVGIWMFRITTLLSELRRPLTMTIRRCIPEPPMSSTRQLASKSRNYNQCRWFLVTEFGFSIGISGNRAVIGSPEGAASFKGSAYVFDLTTGEQLHKLQPSDSRVDDDFGSAVDVFGNVAAIGARGQGSVSGAVYLFDLTTGAELGKLTPSDLANRDKFGSAVALGANRLVAGAPNDVDPVQNLITGSAYLFDVEAGVFGDFNHDGLLTAIDIDMLSTEVRAGTNDADFDLNSDGQVDQTTEFNGWNRSPIHILAIQILMAYSTLAIW